MKLFHVYKMFNYIVNTLYSLKVPTLVDRMLVQPSSQRRGLAASPDALNLLLKRPWDPAHGLVTQHKQVSQLFR